MKLNQEKSMWDSLPICFREHGFSLLKKKKNSIQKVTAWQKLKIHIVKLGGWGM